MRSLKTKNNSKYTVITLLTIMVVLVCAAVAYYILNEQNSSTSVNYDPPTKQEIDSGQDAKKRATEKEAAKQDQGLEKPDNKPDATQARQVSVGVSYADFVGDVLEVRAFANGVIEGTGTCTAKLTKESEVLTASSSAFIDVSSSICRPITFERLKLTEGTWSLSVTYTSPNAAGVSESIEVKI